MPKAASMPPIENRVRVKYELILYKGGKCEKCGYDKIENMGVFNFHHKDPKTKSFAISSSHRSIRRLKEEADKCELLCANCHAEFHGEKYKPFYELVINQHRLKQESDAGKEIFHCNVCDKRLFKRGKYCREHYLSTGGHRKVKKISKDELELLIATLPFTAIGAKFGVSDNAVRKWARSYGLKYKMVDLRGNDPRSLV